ncbi:MAG: CRTAC1 family protein [Myxococcota bacterium]|nr:CRTAC1 family protein [Myxococcota bacterium]
MRTALPFLLLPLVACRDVPKETGAAAVLQDCAPAMVTEHQAWTPDDLSVLTQTKGLVGVAVADLTGDGWLDVVLTTQAGTAFLYNDGTGELAEGTPPEIDLADGWPSGQSIAAVDLEQDGDWDFYIGRARQPDVIAWSVGGSYRVEVLPDSEGSAFSGHFADADGDGDLDLMVANSYFDVEAEDVVAGLVSGDENRLYFQDGGRFLDATERLPADSLDGMTFQAAWVDVESDGDMDLYIANDAGPWIAPNLLLLNDGVGNFTHAPECFCDLAMYAMGVAISDIEQDGDPDLYITDVGGPNLLVSQGDGTFFDGTLAAGADIPPTEQSMTSWGTTAVDLDRDTCDDIAVIFGVSGSNADFVAEIDPTWVDGAEQPDVLLQGDCEGGFQAVDWGFGDRERGRSIAVGDLDRDGRPDLVTAGKPFLRTWRTTGGCETGLTVRPAIGTQAIGARLTVTIGEIQRTSWLLPWTTSSSSAHEWVIGLSGAAQADTITVLWPSGQTTTLTEVAAGSRIDIAPD